MIPSAHGVIVCASARAVPKESVRHKSATHNPTISRFKQEYLSRLYNCLRARFRTALSHGQRIASAHAAAVVSKRSRVRCQRLDRGEPKPSAAECTRVRGEPVRMW